MNAIRLGMGLVVTLTLRAAVGQNLVVNGDFEGGFAQETHLGLGYKVANGWSWCPFPINATQPGRAFEGAGLGMNGSDCQRLRILQSTTGESFVWQTINTVPGKSYTFKAYWKIGPGGCGGNCCSCQSLFPWIGAFFVDGGNGEYFHDHDVVKNFIPDTAFNNPYRMQWPYDPPFIPTTLIIPLHKEIVAERAYFYFYYSAQLATDPQLDYWESIYDAAGGANTPTPPVINVNTAIPGIGMPGIGENASNGGGAAWQTKVAQGTQMIVGFFILDAPASPGDGSELWIDNVSVTEAQPPCPIDLDGDGDVDEADFNLFRSCASGSGIPHIVSTLCNQADFDGDGDVDANDFGRFQRCYSGSGHPMPSGCCQ